MQQGPHWKTFRGGGCDTPSETLQCPVLVYGELGSIMAEAILNRKGFPNFTAYSARSHPAGRGHPEALRQIANAHMTSGPCHFNPSFARVVRHPHGCAGG